MRGCLPPKGGAGKDDLVDVWAIPAEEEGEGVGEGTSGGESTGSPDSTPEPATVEEAATPGVDEEAVVDVLLQQVGHLSPQLRDRRCVTWNRKVSSKFRPKTANSKLPPHNHPN
jgi:hypothetical protein